jgi:type IV secretory pathway TraG/TraD family ATPase VirD4
LNLLDLLKDSADAVAAHQLATAICKIGLLANSNLENFLAYPSTQLIQAVLMLTKEFEYADILTASAILGSDRLTERLMAADFSPWLKMALGQLFSTAGTVTNVKIITASFYALSHLVSTKSVGLCFVGQTNFPLKFKDQQLIVLGFNAKSQNTLSPLMSSILHTIIANNAVNQCFQPFVFTTDEFPFSSLPEDIAIPIIKNSPQVDNSNHEAWNDLIADIVRQKVEPNISLKARELEIERNLPIPQLAN